MTGNISYFTSLSRIDGDNVIYDDNGNGKIIGEDSITNSSLNIDNVLCVEGLNIIS